MSSFKEDLIRATEDAIDSPSEDSLKSLESHVNICKDPDDCDHQVDYQLWLTCSNVYFALVKLLADQHGLEEYTKLFRKEAQK